MTALENPAEAQGVTEDSPVRDPVLSRLHSYEIRILVTWCWPLALWCPLALGA